MKYIHENGCIAKKEKGITYQVYDKDGALIADLGEKELLDFGFTKEKEMVIDMEDFVKGVKFAVEKIKEMAGQDWNISREIEMKSIYQD